MTFLSPHIYVTKLIRTLTWDIYKYEINIGLIGHY